MYDHNEQSILAKEAADGPQVIDNTGFEGLFRHQVCIEVPSAPTAGAMKIEIRHPGATAYMEVEGSPVSMTALNHEVCKILLIEAFVGGFRLTPTDALDTTYNAHVKSVKA
jgi:hypothetical protein